MGKIITKNYDFFKKRIDNLSIHKQTLQYVSLISYVELVCSPNFRFVAATMFFLCVLHMMINSFQLVLISVIQVVTTLRTRF